MKSKKVEITISGEVWEHYLKEVIEEFLYIVEVNENESIESVITE